MSASPFAFLRGAAAVMARDLAGTAMTGINVQACGDAHFLNFGIFASPERRLVFDTNDFDETLPAPFEWDVKRLAVSVVVAARGRSFPASDCAAAAHAAAESYRTQLTAFAALGHLDVWYAHIEVCRTWPRCWVRPRHGSSRENWSGKRNTQRTLARSES